MRSLFALALLTAACATTPPARIDAAPLVAAEHAFAADAAAYGWVPAFRAFVAPDAIILHPDPVGAAAFYAGTPDDGDKTLAWRPRFAGIARSGDLGFTTGPVAVGADPKVVQHYFTVWRRQPDGGWKWIFDGGIGVADPAPFPGGEAAMLPVATGGAGSAAAAIAQVEALERAHPTADAIARVLADEARVNRVGRPPAVGRADAATLVALPTPSLTTAPLRAEASAAGDLVLSICDAKWSEGETARRGHAVRVWQWQAGVWRVVYDELVPVRLPG